MKLMGTRDVIGGFSKAIGKHILYLRIPDFKSLVMDEKRLSGREYFDHILMAAPYLEDTWQEEEASDDKFHLSQSVLDGELIIVCESYEEMDRLYYLTVGDDGPTTGFAPEGYESNAYEGPMRIYAATISPEEGWLTENT